ncbi:helix-turn-helix domain-containing protein [Clostridium perfringens]|uniref:Helix-turn-helix domain-containing protein n=1 Tax=Clostridium perfringens TaxID=1502 RepID=A0AAW9IG15_CLOPF|nr:MULTISPECIES: helix-turn-helix transcriptional regulator [Clostridiaceae]MBU5322782.1 helix-turn-helix domain-containing protein [Sarcina ventriculi]MDK0796963.1 helix-turn-helix transcriptional regulator [Clostridium perfringens]MDM0469907.1 helix-turn-helix transcriptional regulator [Clostridium perfringens]MDM0991273.1 helix-turn-helix transcriptional regulator [Clostridium perfringens]MDU7955296.1 helix-turn-helix transcriptional regulator [Clostridium perfringens]
MEIGESIKNIRKNKKINQKTLAERAEISCSYLCDIEKGRTNPSVKTMLRLFKELGVEIEIDEIVNKKISSKGEE